MNSKETKSIWVTVLATLFVIAGVYQFISTRQETPPTQPKILDSRSSPTIAPTVFYTQTVANVRSCASTSCAPLGTYPANTNLSLPYVTINDLPEWVDFSFSDTSGATQTGYINKMTLGTNKVSVAPVKQENTTETPIYAAPTYTETNSSCKLKAEGVLNSSWIRTCYLRGSLTAQCQPLFDADGYHKNFPATGDPNWSTKFGQILSDFSACECGLPADIVSQLKATQQSSNEICDRFYPN